MRPVTFALIFLGLTGCHHSGRAKITGGPGVPTMVQYSQGHTCGEGAVAQNEVRQALPPQAAPIVPAPAPFPVVAPAYAAAPAPQPPCAIPAIGLGSINLRLPCPKFFAVPVPQAPPQTVLPAGTIAVPPGQMPMMAGQMPVMPGQAPIMAGGAAYPGVVGGAAYPGMMPNGMMASPYPVAGPGGMPVAPGMAPVNGIQQVAAQQSPQQNAEAMAALLEVLRKSQAQNAPAAAPNAKEQEQLKQIRDFEERIDRITKQLERGSSSPAAAPQE